MVKRSRLKRRTVYKVVFPKGRRLIVGGIAYTLPDAKEILQHYEEKSKKLKGKIIKSTTTKEYPEFKVRKRA
jgi:hypothetical protein